MHLERYRRFVDAQRARALERALRPAGPAGARTVIGGRTLLNFSSNDYLGLARHPALIRRAQEYAAAWGTGAGASRLVTGNLDLYGPIEQKLARAKRAEAALVLGTGFQANATVLPALLDAAVLGAEPLVYCDRLVHASLHHGVAAAGARERRFQHNDLDHLASLLARDASEPGPRFIVTESVFSMDGDRADVAGLVDVAERHGAFLYLDEAHATGVLGPEGFGLASAFPGRVALAMGTFSKALGSYGAYCACSADLRDYLVQRCAGLIYSTALPPPVLGAIDAALELVPGLDAERARLLANAARLREGLAALGLDASGSTTQIVPARLGSESAALELSRALEADGILAVAIRPPTVPAGTSRLRFSLTADHAAADVDGLLDALARAVGRSRA